jgi:hypothetical protein
MVASVTAVLSRFKTEWATQLPPEAIIGACEEAGYTSWRDRGLTPVTTIQLFLWICSNFSIETKEALP